ncbi:MAG: glycosyltransferase [Flavobacteriales bacterium]|nr:MAG: glycosyltransferase [Flavobacteriales bacterium]
MKIAVNTRLLLEDKLEGIGWFAFETLKRITKNHQEHEFVFIFDRPFSEEFIFSDNVKPVVIGPQARHPLLYYWWFEYSIPKILKKEKADLFLSPDGYLSLASPVRQVQVIHDLNFEHYPQDLPFLERWNYRHFFPKYARKAVRIATVSEFSKNDTVEQYGISPKKITVIYNGANENYRPISEEERQAARKKHAGGKPYFLFIGSLHPRKNVANLFRAFDAFKKSSGNDVQLLIVGEKKWWTGEMRQAFENMEHKTDVVFVGRKGTNELQEIIPSALALVYVSYFEGFGIPIVEAMNCDVPVITSNVTSMPEVVGDAALLVDPFSANSIKDAMLKMASDENLRQSLIEKGRNRRRDFSWEKTAEGLWRVVAG